MANRDLLREAIADAKAVKEVAIANAKAALEEAFTPQLKSMLSEKISQLDEEDDISEADKVIKEKEEMEEAKKLEKKGKEKMDEAEDMDEGYGKEDMKEAEDMDEELDLDELLAELELEEGGGEDMDEAYDVDESDHMDEGDDMYEEEEAETETETEEEINLEDMSEDDLKSFIEDVIEDMIEDGELVPGPEADESEEEEEEGKDEEGEIGDADVDVDVDLQENEEVEEEILNEDFTTETLMQLAEILGLGLPAIKAMVMAAGVTSVAGLAALMTKLEGVFPKAAKKLQGLASSLSAGIKGGTTSNEGFEASNNKELKEAKLVIKHLQTELDEVNLLNSKLLYTNKIFKAKNLTENQKIKVLKAFDKAETVQEAKTIFETLNENLVNKSTKSNIKESIGLASKSAGVAPKRLMTEQKVVEEDAMVSRFKKLAGIK